jgi:hypothetical protein
MYTYESGFTGGVTIFRLLGLGLGFGLGKVKFRVRIRVKF